MKKISLIIFLIILNFGCEKVVEIDLDFNEKRYVIDAKINKHVSSDKAFSEVRISKSRPYFSDIIQYVNDANANKIAAFNNSALIRLGGGQGLQNLGIIINDALETGVEYLLNHFGEGLYSIYDFNIVPESDYELVINHGDNQFTSVEKLSNSSLIDNVIQGERNSLSDDIVEIVTTFTDRPELDNYYLFEYGKKGNLQPARDLYINGNSFTFSYFMNKDDIPQNRELSVRMEGIDYDYFKYMIQIVIQTNTQNGPFSTPPAPILGNIVNINNNESTVFGYFKVCEYDEYVLKNILID